MINPKPGQIIHETLPNFIKRKHPRKGEKRKQGERPKSRQANSPIICHDSYEL
jgi:hypothetical protein